MSQGRLSFPRSSGLGKKIFMKSAVWFGFIGLALYGVEVFLEHSERTGAHLAQHLSIAFLVAAVSIVGIEFNARKRMQQELEQFQERFAQFEREVKNDRKIFNQDFEEYKKQAEEALQGLQTEFTKVEERISDILAEVLRRLVNQALVNEIKYVLGIPFSKTECEYTLRFQPPHDGMNSDWCVLQRDLAFTVTNIGQEPKIFPVRSSFTTDKNFATAGWSSRPVHLKLTVNGSDIPPAKYLREEGFVLDYPVLLQPQESAHIFLRGEEPIRIEPNRSFYQQSTPADALDISIQNYFPEAIGSIDVQMHHPGRDFIDRNQDQGRFSLKRAFMPGQGFEVIWKRTTTP